MKWITPLLALSTLTCLAQSSQSQEKDPNQLSIGIPKLPTTPSRVEIEQRNGSMVYDAPAGVIKYKDSFKLTTNTGLQIRANSATMLLKDNRIDLLGNISIYQGGLFQRGNSATYFLEDQSLTTNGLRVSMNPILLEAGSFRNEIDKNGKTYFIGENAGITTHDYEHPNFWLKSDVTKVYPDDKITFKNLKIYVGKTPVFWLPYLAQPLDAELGYHFAPGAKSNWGGYLLNRYGFMVGKGNNDSILSDAGQPWLQGQALLDFRTRRGVGAGIEFKDTRLKDNENLTGFKFYYINDLAPNITRSGLTRNFVNEDRFRIELKHRHFLSKGIFGETFIDANLTHLSDQYYREDFESRLYRVDPEPNNTISFLHRNDSWLAGITSSLRLNSFYQTDSRLPEVFVDRIKAPIFNSPVLYESHSSIGKYEEKLGDLEQRSLTSELNSLLAGDPRIAEINTLLDDRGFNRFHTFHDFTLPLHLKRGVAIAPFLSAGHTKYWGIDNGLADFDRTHFQTGVDVSLKFSKRFPNFRNRKLAIDGLMHVFQPYSTFSYLKTNELDASFRAIDRLTPSTNLRPIRVGRFNAIDQINDWSIIRLGMRNNLITNRDGSSHSWLNMNSYIDVFLNDPELDRNFSNLYNEINWHPLPWLKFDLEAQFPFASSGSGFSEYSTSTTFMPNRSTEISVGYNYLNSHPTLEDSSRVDIRAYSRLNEKWGASFYQRWELDDGTLETQQYSVHRDLGSWSASLGVIRRNNRIKKELGVMLSFTLKDFPSLTIPLSLDTE